ncbi:MAG TPA: hypothetical protein VFV37_04680 [Luteibaculaceae bacterium]|nr:hypothetical protein [Luteibaculaceae bacterium]
MNHLDSRLLQQLGLHPDMEPDEEDAIDALLQKTFEIKTFFLTQTVIPPLFEKRIKQLQDLCGLQEQLSLLVPEPVDLIPAQIRSIRAVDLIDQWHEEQGRVKLAISQSEYPSQLLPVARYWLAISQTLEKEIHTAIPKETMVDMNMTAVAGEIKISTPVDYLLIKKELLSDRWSADSNMEFLRLHKKIKHT